MRDRDRRAADFYAALSRTNGAILRVRERDPLLWDICRICVEHGAAMLAYIAPVEDGAARPVAWAGPAEMFLPGLRIPLDPASAESRGPIASAIRTGQRYITNDLFAGPVTLPWHDRARRLGSQATAAFPIRCGGQVVGALSLHFAQRDFFDKVVVDRLDEMAADLSFALDDLAREVAPQRAVREAESGYERFQKIFDATPVATLISTVEEGRLVAVNDAYCTLMGLRREALIGRTTVEVGNWLHAGERAQFVARLARARRVRDQEVRVRVASGELRDVAMSAELIEFEGQSRILAILNDVTERKRLESRIRFLATHDGLTELPNRTLMLDRIVQAIQHARHGSARPAVMYVDLDRFKVLNDDFGTGYSNLGYLKRFQLDRLEIDQSFARNVDTRAGDAAIALAVISLARSLQLEVTAEGVENAAQCDFMKRDTCDEIQGFYVSRPVRAETFAAMLREGRRH